MEGPGGHLDMLTSILKPVGSYQRISPNLGCLFSLAGPILDVVCWYSAPVPLFLWITGGWLLENLVPQLASGEV